MSLKGILLINLGTPEQCDAVSVRRYLKTFLNDARVVDLPNPLRWLIVNAFIVPFRYKNTLRAYQKIWLKEGSPLLINSLAIQNALSQTLGSEYQVELGMRYGKPAIETALQKLKKCETLVVIPLYPQYSSAATGSALSACLKKISTQWNVPHLKILKDFYNDAGFIEAYAAVFRESLCHKKFDYILFSYHGLPVRHLQKSGCKSYHVNGCLTKHCPSMEKENLYCYRAQCYATSHLLAKALDLKPNQYQVCFQSRLGRTAWIKPYTDEVLPQLIAAGVRHIAIGCPSFVADCLETLEEINIRARQQWQSLGGETFTFVPALNDHPLWIKALARQAAASILN